MNIEKGFCHCGCGGKTTIAEKTHRKRKRVKGEPIRYINGHYAKRGKDNPNWKGGTFVSGGCGWIRKSGGYIKDYRLMCENALNKPIPPGAVIHHYPNRKNCSTLINGGEHGHIQTQTISLADSQIPPRLSSQEQPQAHYPTSA